MNHYKMEERGKGEQTIITSEEQVQIQKIPSEIVLTPIYAEVNLS